MRLFSFFFDMQGRARRRDLWLFTLLLLTAWMWLLFGGLSLDPLQGVAGEAPVRGFSRLAGNQGLFLLFAILNLSYAIVAVKRLHDLERSGFGLMAAFVPVVGWLWLGYQLFLAEGTDGSNRYGPSPRGHSSLTAL